MTQPKKNEDGEVNGDMSEIKLNKEQKTEKKLLFISHPSDMSTK